MKFLVVAALLALAVAGNAATIGDLAASTPDLSTLAAAIKAANLTAATQDKSAQWTVFAPTNEAFADLLSRLGVSASTLLADTQTLTAVLQYHIVPGVAKAADLKNGQVIQTLLPGGEVTVEKGPSGVFLVPTGGPRVKVTTADIVADNGVIHIIDGVLLPGVAGAPAAESD